MKKNLIILAVAALALFASCSDKKTAQSVADKCSTSMAGYTAYDGGDLDLTSAIGIYEGTFPTDSPGIKTVLNIKADSTYQLEQDYANRKDGHDEASGIFKTLDGKVLMLVRPSSGDHTFFKVKEVNSIVMTDSIGNEPEGETA